MSVTVTTDVFCDGCSRWAHYGCASVAQVAEAQEGARRAGWTFNKAREAACPECNGSKPTHGYWGWGSAEGPPTLPRGKP